MTVRANLRLAVIGLGLIGGSVALALKESGLVAEVIGYDVEHTSVEKAAQIGAIDCSGESVEEAVAEADVVFLCTPIPIILDLLPLVGAAIKPGTLVTDVGSTKCIIMQRGRECLPKSADFIGGHPMAGSEKGGIGVADPYLFENAIYVLTPDPDSSPQAVGLMERLAKAMGARPAIMSSIRHDQVVAGVSHLPHLVASTLAGTVAHMSETEKMMVELAAGGLRDTTRVAAGDAKLWNGILMSNREPVLGAIERFEAVLGQIRVAIQSSDDEALTNALNAAAVFRKGLPQTARGLLSSSFELTVRVVDEPGMLSKITTLLSQVGVNIMDIEILHIREGEGGALRLAVASRECLASALRVLHANGYQAWSRS